MPTTGVRSSLAPAVRSAAVQILPPDVSLDIVVCVSGGAAIELATILGDCPEQVSVRVVSATKGYSDARNALLDTVNEDLTFFAWMDDDEIAERNWISELIRVAEEEGADIVVGPVRAVPDGDKPFPRWFTAVGLDQLRAQQPKVPITGNSLVRAAFWRTNPLYFDQRFNATGGEDTAWFRGLIGLGARVVWAGSAIVTEPLGPERLTRRYWWLRHLRAGRALAAVKMSEHRARDAAWIVVHGLARLAIGLPLGVVGALVQSEALLYRGARAAARGAGLLTARWHGD